MASARRRAPASGRGPAAVETAHAGRAWGQAAQAVLHHAPAGMSKVFFTDGDADEKAIRMARPRPRAGEGPPCHLQRVIEGEGPASVTAILFVPVVGTGGVLVPPSGYLAGVSALGDGYGIVLISDEVMAEAMAGVMAGVMAGFGRAGAWFVFDQFDVRPELHHLREGCQLVQRGRLKVEMLARGLHPLVAEHRIHVVPLCVVTDDECARTLGVDDDVLAVVEKEVYT